MKYGYVVIQLIMLTSCSQFLDVELTKSQISSEVIFSSDATATSAMTGVYNEMLNELNFASGSYMSISSLTGLSSDEMTYPSYSNLDLIQFYENSLVENNATVLSVWESLYKVIYETNSILEGLDGTQKVNEGLRKQLRGEALFMRAFANFYLVNLYGPVPLVLSTDYKINATLRRAGVDEVYNKIISDLNEADGLIGDEYVTFERVRPNRASVRALLSRTYLYMENWQKAEEIATLVIDDGKYSLNDELGEIFLANSSEAIWQLKPVNPTRNTNEAVYFVIVSSPQYTALNGDLVNSFDVDDKRRQEWISTYDDGGEVFSFPFKYKVFVENQPLTEYSMVLRLAEQYLIRSEARANQGKLESSIGDLDSIRGRAGLDLISQSNPGIDRESLLNLIQVERRHEMFSEWGHRWFDLKRLNKSDDIIGPVKANWEPTDVLYPIPQSERARNPNLGVQNLGY